MSKNTIPCKICGKPFMPCLDDRVIDWRRVTCSPECGQKYFHKKIEKLEEEKQEFKVEEKLAENVFTENKVSEEKISENKIEEKKNKYAVNHNTGKKKD